MSVPPSRKWMASGEAIKMSLLALGLLHPAVSPGHASVTQCWEKAHVIFRILCIFSAYLFFWCT